MAMHHEKDKKKVMVEKPKASVKKDKMADSEKEGSKNKKK